MNKKWLWLVLAILVVALVAWYFARPGQAKVVQSAFQPQVDKIIRGNLTVEVSASGIIQPINKVEIKSKASGLIEDMPVEASDHVAKGDLIARLDQRDTKNSYDQALADLQVAEANVKQKDSDFVRKKELYEKGLLSAADYDLARLAVVESQAQLVRAKINVDNNDIRFKDTTVRSPIDGIILTKDVEIGQIISSGISSVSGGTLIATVAEMNRVYVKADVDEVDIGRVRPGMHAKVAADAFPDQIFFGEVIRISAQSKVVQNVTTFEVTIQVNNPSERLKAGMNATVDILVADKKDILLVANEALMPQKDLKQELNKLRMLLAEEGGTPSGRPAGERGQRAGGRTQKADAAAATGDTTTALRRGVIIKQGDEFKPRMVQTGVSNLDYTEVIDGLHEGDEVVYSFFSRAKAQSDELRQRMSNMNNMRSGLRN